MDCAREEDWKPTFSFIPGLSRSIQQVSVGKTLRWLQFSVFMPLYNGLWVWLGPMIGFNPTEYGNGDVAPLITLHFMKICLASRNNLSFSPPCLCLCVLSFLCVYVCMCVHMHTHVFVTSFEEVSCHGSYSYKKMSSAHDLGDLENRSFPSQASDENSALPKSNEPYEIGKACCFMPLNFW